MLRLIESFYVIPMPAAASTNPVARSFRIALLSDLHNHPYDEILASLQSRKPDIIAIPGDLIHGSRPDVNRPVVHLNLNILPFLNACRSIAPVYFSPGNHEWMLSDADRNEIANTGTILLDNSWTRDAHTGCCIGGLSSGTMSAYQKYRTGLYENGTVSRDELYPLYDDRILKARTAPRTDWIPKFEKQPGFRILLSHHPEYRDRYLSNFDIDLILSGHAHGGQIRLFGHGLFAPGQGPFPRYTGGKHGNMIISRGLSNTVRFVPRLFNPGEIVYIDVQ